MKTKVILLLLLFFFINNTTYSKKIEILAKVNNDIITNIDLNKEYKLYEFISKSKLNLDLQAKQRFLNTLINHQIKKSELKKFNINIKRDIIIKRINLILKSKNSNADELKSLNLYNFFYDRVETEMKWVELIRKMFRNRLSINTKEVENKVSENNDKNFSKQDYNNLIRLEKNKKMAVYNQTFFNEIKLNYLVNVLQK
ncbi:MAG: hypothetical protein CMI74_00895 [Candidatus Pelagibacter sp.]|nr:hypothetical protein [Candidatus Pelagibacter sp.]|tara:strand:+ start:14744 stop:15340 length:597 start_codon:yes stop_codon:yes gene_type:complete